MLSANVNIYFISMIFSETSLPEKFYSVNIHLQLNYTAKSSSGNACKRTRPTIIHRIQDVGCRVKNESIYRMEKYFVIFFALQKVFFKSKRVQIEIVCAIFSV